MSMSAFAKPGTWRRFLVGALCLAASGAVARAEDPPPPVPTPTPAAPAEEPPLVEAERAPGVPLEARVVGPLPVIGPEPVVDLRTIPGSGSSVTQKEARLGREPLSVQDVVRSLPGVVVRGESTAGILPNIGVRGLNPDRSEKLLVLEDGVPAGLAPYVENASYYMPPFERLERIELLKGSGSILYGPHTVGGVLNLITPQIPQCLSGHVRVTGGTDGYLLGYAHVGQTVGRFGYHFSGLGKRGDGWRDNESFDVHDATAKLRWTFSPCTNVTFKVNAYHQESHDTYLGLTTGMFEADAYQNPIEHDLLDVEWYSAQVTVQHHFSSQWELLTNVYGSWATRTWNRQDYTRNTGFAAPPANTVATVGDPTIDGGAIFLRASYGSRDREFTKYGIEPRLIGDHCVFGRDAELHVGMRFHTEEMIDERNNRATLHAPVVTRERDVRSVDAWAFFAQEKVQVTRRLGLSAGARVEAYEIEREIDVAAGLPVDIRGSSDNVEVIPGAGFTYELACNHTLFGGVHRGFSPPRTSQAISSTGTDRELDAERSWEYELGVRGRTRWLTYELTGFYYDFENQVVPANQSGGASTADTNAGQTRHLGFETAASIDLTHALTGRCDRCRTAFHLDLGYTFVETENITPNGTFRGNDLPYAPEHVAWIGLRMETPRGLSFGIVGHYVDDQFTDQAATLAPSNDGLIGQIEDRFLVDATLRWRIPRSSLTATLAVNNVFDETYIASRAPEGIHPGAPLHGFFGLEVDF
jgi:Fe(3+) dicitrate transport protein